jgi:hypothetical protein
MTFVLYSITAIENLVYSGWIAAALGDPSEGMNEAREQLKTALSP